MEKLLTLPNGDVVYHYNKSIVTLFKGKRKVLSTSVYNGGYHEDFQAIYNYDCKLGPGMGCEMLAESYVEHMKLVSKRLGLEPEYTSGMGTAADMKNVAIAELSYKELTVTAVVTGGIETNGGRAGDPADYYRPIEKPDLHGTINIMLFINCDMPAGTLARALVTCTEAKTAAIQELYEGSNYSTGLATGSGTDQTIIVANAGSDLYLEGAGKHAKMGELIGRVVKQAVKETVGKQSGLTPVYQHNIFRRLRRFKVTAEDIWQLYLEKTKKPVWKAEFLLELEGVSKDNLLLTETTLYIHLLDQLLWGLLCEAEVLQSANRILKNLAVAFEVEEIVLERAGLESLLKAWKQLVELIMEKKCNEDEI